MSTGFKDHFSAAAAGYAAHRPTYPVELGAYLRSLAPPEDAAGEGEGVTVWDGGCGTGQLSILLAEDFDSVIATDASAEQIANATPHPKITYRVAPAEASGLSDGEAHVVTVAQAAHWFDQDAFHAEVRRVCRPGGALALITYGVIEADGAVGEVLGGFYHGTLAGMWPTERRHVEAGYRTLPFPFPELEAPPLAMRADWTMDRVVGYVDTWSAVRQLERVHGRGPVTAFADRLREAWGPSDQPREIRWPLSLRVGRL